MGGRALGRAQQCPRICSEAAHLAFDELVCRYHDALRKVSLEGKSRQEAATALNRSPADVRNHVHRGRKKLSQYIREEVDRYAASQRQRDTELECLARLLS